MNKLVVHIEWSKQSLNGVEDALDIELEALFGPDGALDGADAGWRFFKTLEEAVQWERGRVGQRSLYLASAGE